MFITGMAKTIGCLSKNISPLDASKSSHNDRSSEEIKILIDHFLKRLPGNDLILLILANREYGIFSIVSHNTVWIVPFMVS